MAIIETLSKTFSGKKFYLHGQIIYDIKTLQELTAR
jgi:hypothetical protein